MSLRTVNLSLNCRKTGFQSTIEGLHVGDVGSTQFVVTLTDGIKKIDFAEYETVTAVIHGRKPDNTEIYNECEVENGKIYYTLTAQDTAVMGTVVYQLDVTISDNSGLERSFSPTFRARVSPVIYEPVYRLLETVPTDWQTDYRRYFRKSGDNYVQIDDDTCPEFVSNTFYVCVDPPIESVSEYLAFWAAYNNVAALFSKRLVIDTATTDITFDEDNIHKVFINATVEGEKGIVLTALDNTQFFIGRGGSIKKRLQNGANTYPNSWTAINAVDSELSSSSKNPVQNKKVYEALSGKASSADVANSIEEINAALASKANAADIPTVPSNVSAFTNDSGYITAQDISGKANTVDVNAALALKANVSDIPNIPANVSAFVNDAGYLTQHQSLSDYYTYKVITGSIYSAADNQVDDIHTIYRVYTGEKWGLMFNLKTNQQHTQIVLCEDGHVLYRQKLVNAEWGNTAFTDIFSGYAAANHTHSEYLTEHQDVSGKENISSKINSITDDSSVLIYYDDQGIQHTKDPTVIYPTYNAVKNYVGYKVGEVEEYINETIELALEDKVDKATTLSGYGITDAYTKTQVDAAIQTAIGGAENGSY